jgi:hypothetical protein
LALCEINGTQFPDLEAALRNLDHQGASLRLIDRKLDRL